MSALKLTQIGNSVGVILPKEILARLNVVTLSAYDPSIDEQVKAGREFMREYRDTFQQLAK